jgi:hypothetical protein
MDRVDIREETGRKSGMTSYAIVLKHAEGESVLARCWDFFLSQTILEAVERHLSSDCAVYPEERK